MGHRSKGAVRVMEGKQDLVEWDGPKYARTHEVMLCESCSPEMYQDSVIKKLKLKIKEYERPGGGCFRVNGQLVLKLPQDSNSSDGGGDDKR